MIQTVSLSDICTKITSGGTPLTKRDDYYGGGIPWLRTQEVNFGNIYSTEKTITELGLNNSSAKIIPKDSVIVAMYGATAGKSAINKIPLTTNQACCNLIIDNNKADYRFVYYYLVNSYEKLLSAAVGAAQQNLGSKQISAMTINLPPLYQQKKIADILSSLDEKIELNRRMNETLEQLGQALFRHYFVDNPEAKDWENIYLGDIVEITTGKGSNKANLSEYGKYPLYGANGVMGRSQNYLLNEKVIVTGRVGTLGVVRAVVDKAWFSDNVIIMKPDPSIFGYVFYVVCGIDYASLNRGSTQPLITQTDLKNQRVKLPPLSTLQRFENSYAVIFNQIQANKRQMSTLVAIRDSLLPKLISGEIEV